MNDVFHPAQAKTCSAGHLFSLLFGLALVGAFSAPAAAPVTLTIEAGKPAHKISPNLYGIFFEDINYGADGGLYGELIQNRSFEFSGADALFGWSQVQRGSALGALTLKTERPLNAQNPHFLRIEAVAPGDGLGVANSGFGGIVLKKGSNYLFSVWARAIDTSTGSLTVQLENAKGQAAGFATIVGINPSWNRYIATIKASLSETNGQLTVVATTPGVIDLDMISLFPQDTFKNRPNGMRSDLAQLVADLKPSFMRFPGGCIVEGKDLANRYRWKDTIGDVSERKINWNRWQSAMPKAAPQYYQSYGLGFFEFFQFCEDIGTEPLPILNCGMSCQCQGSQLVPLDELDPYIQDALDLIEFANGSEDTVWGAKRAAMGHPEPFNMKFLGIGNEQFGEDYFQRYERFASAIKAKYPEIQLISSAGLDPDGERFDLAWSRLRKLNADIIDEHYYRPSAWFLSNAGRYDKYDRTGPKVFAGEFAVHTSSRRNNLEAALAEAAFMTGLERNSDVVVMASYAPLLARVDHYQWDVNLIWFDKYSAYGSPSYYVQQMFSRNRGDTVLPVEVADSRPVTTNLTSRFFATASRADKTGQVIVKAVNPGTESVNVQLLVNGVGSITSKAQAIVLSGASSTNENSFLKPALIAPVATSFKGASSKFRYKFKPSSVTILRIDTQTVK